MQEWNQFYPSTQHSFVQLLTSQFVAAHWSNPLLYPNIWSETCAEQHMNKSTSDNDDTKNVISKDEDRLGNASFDPHIKDEDEEYIELTRNDSDHGPGNASLR